MGVVQRADVPVGVVTLLFTDIEGSTRLLQELGDGYETVLHDHRRLLRQAWQAHGGVEMGAEGDGFFVAFAEPRSAIDAAVAAQRALEDHAWPSKGALRVRMGIHTGTPRLRDGDYWGVDVHYAARLCAAAHGGQVLVSGATAGLVSLPLEDLGEHAVKDFPTARRIFHLPIDGRGPAVFPPPRTLRTGQTNLPDQLSRFIGRDEELALLRETIERNRLTTLVGPGGVGKTRLSLRLGAEVLDGTGDGVWFADLAPLSDPALVASRVAQAVGVNVRGGRDPLEALLDVLADRRLLIVLDNCEHVIQAAAELTERLLALCPEVFVLATSREPLRIAGEHVHRVRSLLTPGEDVTDPATVAASEAVVLFVDRAIQQRPGFAVDTGNAALLAAICRRLDGIPLAIELAAVRLRSMSIADLHARLDRRLALLKGGSRTAQPRQQTLLALIDWSYELLGPDERIVLARLAVFAAGGFDLSAAEAVCARGSISDLDVLDHLDALVDKSLVQAEDTSSTVRYRLLETVREYAAIKLDALGEAAAEAEAAAKGEAEAARRAHRDHYLALAEAAREGLEGRDRLQWLDRLSLEQDNLRAALAESLRDPDPEPGLRLTYALRNFWGARGHAREGADALRRALDHASADASSLVRGRALTALSHLLTNWLGGYDEAIRAGELAIDVGRATGDEWLLTEALSRVAWARLHRGEYDTALALIEEGLEMSERIDDLQLRALLVNGRGAAISVMGGDGRPDFERTVALARETENPNLIAAALQNLGWSDLVAGDHRAARARLEEALGIHRELQEVTEVAFVATNLGFACILSGDPGAAGQRFAETIAAVGRDGDPSLLGRAYLGTALVSDVDEVAAQLHGAADAILEQIGYGTDEILIALRDDDRRQRSEALGEAGFAAARSTGASLDRAAAARLAFRVAGGRADA